MKRFFLWFIFTFFLSGLYIFCNQYGIGNIPSTPIPLNKILYRLPYIFVVWGLLVYFFMKNWKK